MALNKDKLLLVLYSSKTHDKESRPQKITITSNNIERTGNYKDRHFCPFKLMRRYMQLRGGYESDEEQLFVFRDNNPVTPVHAHNPMWSFFRRHRDHGEHCVDT